MSNQISTPVIGTKENPLFVTSEEELKQAQKNKIWKIKYFCTSCNREVIRNSWSSDVLLCKPCKSSKTCREKYGVEHPGQIPFVKEHIRETIEKNGGYTYQRASSMEKVKKTLIEKYGVDNPNKCREVRQKIENTCLERYGAKSPMASEEIKNKIKETTIKNHGKDFWRNNLKQASLKKFGVENPFYLEEIRRQKFYEYDNEKFDSSYELYFYIYNKDNGKNIIRNKEKYFEYLYKDGKMHKYFPDFEIDSNFFEIKGEQFFNENNQPIDCFGNDWSEKYNCIIENRVNIITYSEIKEMKNFVESKYGIDFISNLKVLKK